MTGLIPRPAFVTVAASPSFNRIVKCPDSDAASRHTVDRLDSFLVQDTELSVKYSLLRFRASVLFGAQFD